MSGRQAAYAAILLVAALLAGGLARGEWAAAGGRAEGAFWLWALAAAYFGLRGALVLAAAMRGRR